MKSKDDLDSAFLSYWFRLYRYHHRVGLYPPIGIDNFAISRFQQIHTYISAPSGWPSLLLYWHDTALVPLWCYWCLVQVRSIELFIGGKHHN